MTILRVKPDTSLLYPDGSFRGGCGYRVDTDADGEDVDLAGQEDKLEEADQALPAHPRDGRVRSSKAAAPKPKPKKKAKKKTKKKASKRG